MKKLFFNVIISAAQGKLYFINKYIKNNKVLDLGCGSGKLLKKNKKNSFGIDINPESLLKAKKNKFSVLLGSATNIPFKANTFSTVNCDNLIEHLQPSEVYKLIKDSTRVLKQNGYLILITPQPTRMFWNTLSHIRPYTSLSIIQIITDSINKESYPTIKQLKPYAIYHEGYYFKNRWLYLLSTLFAQLLPFARKGYVIILKKKINE